MLLHKDVVSDALPQMRLPPIVPEGSRDLASELVERLHHKVDINQRPEVFDGSADRNKRVEDIDRRSCLLPGEPSSTHISSEVFAELVSNGNENVVHV